MKTNHTPEEFDRLKAVNAELLAALEKCVELLKAELAKRPIPRNTMEMHVSH